MNWQQEAIGKLRLHKSRRHALESMQSEMAAEDNCNLDSMVRMRELQRQFIRTQMLVKSIDDALDLMDAQERLVLEQLYIYPIKNGIDWLCGQMDCSVSSIYRMREKAIYHFTVLLYGFSE